MLQINKKNWIIWLLLHKHIEINKTNKYCTQTNKHNDTGNGNLISYSTEMIANLFSVINDKYINTIVYIRIA